MRKRVLNCAWVTLVSSTERERDACDVIDITLKSRVITHIITSTAHRPYASTNSVFLSLSSDRIACKTRTWRLSVRSSSRVEWLTKWGSGSFAFAGHPAVDHQQHFVGMLQARRKTKLMFVFFSHGSVLPLRTGWIANIISQASLPGLERQRCWKRGSGDGRRFWDYMYCTARLSNILMPLTGEARRSPEPSARPSAAADSEERQICATCLFAESVGLCLSFLPLCAMYKDNAVGNVVAETCRDLVYRTTIRLSDLSMPLKGEVRRTAARQPIARSGKFVRRAYSWRALGCEKTTVLLVRLPRLKKCTEVDLRCTSRLTSWQGEMF